jgi:hypothetical protein
MSRYVEAVALTYTLTLMSRYVEVCRVCRQYVDSMSRYVETGLSSESVDPCTVSASIFRSFDFPMSMCMSM